MLRTRIPVAIVVFILAVFGVASMRSMLAGGAEVLIAEVWCGPEECTVRSTITCRSSLTIEFDERTLLVEVPADSKRLDGVGLRLAPGTHHVTWSVPMERMGSSPAETAGAHITTTSLLPAARLVPKPSRQLAQQWHYRCERAGFALFAPPALGESRDARHPCGFFAVTNASIRTADNGVQWLGEEVNVGLTAAVTESLTAMGLAATGTGPLLIATPGHRWVRVTEDSAWCGRCVPISSDARYSMEDAYQLGLRLFWARHGAAPWTAESDGWARHGVAGLAAMRFARAFVRARGESDWDADAWLLERRTQTAGVLCSLADPRSILAPRNCPPSVLRAIRESVCPLALLTAASWGAGRSDVEANLDRLLAAAVSVMERPASVEALVPAEARIWRTDLPRFVAAWFDAESMTASYAPLDQARPDPAQATTAEVRVVISANTAGFLETCGCAVNQSGGAAKRNELIRKLREGGPVLVVDAGNRFQPLAERRHAEEILKQESSLIGSLFSMAEYDAIVPSADDLVLPERINAESGKPSYATVNVWDRETGSRIGGVVHRRIGDKSISIVGIATWFDGKRLRQQVPSLLMETRHRVEPWLAECRRIVTRERECADCVFVVGALDEGEVYALTDDGVGAPDCIITSDDTAWPRGHGKQAGTVESHSCRGVPVLVAANVAGFGVTVARVTIGARTQGIGPPTGVRVEAAEIVMLDDRVSETPAARALIDDFYKSVASATSWDLPPIHPGNAGPGYVGSQRCAECHAEIHRQWRMSAHGKAFETLVRRRRNYVPDCVRCHVVGMGEATGYDTIWETQDSDGLSGVGCESCHGGGADHVRAPTRTNTRRQTSEVQCKACHDDKHSPDFEFATFLHKIKHW